MYPGQGKFSYVFKAKRTSDSKLIALKLIKIFDMDNEHQRDTCLKEVQLHQVSSFAKLKTNVKRLLAGVLPPAGLHLI